MSMWAACLMRLAGHPCSSGLLLPSGSAKSSRQILRLFKRALLRVLCRAVSMPEGGFMGLGFLEYGGCLALALPFLLIVAILLYYCARRSAWRCGRRRAGANPAFCPSSAALGTILLFAQIFYRPSVAYVAEARQEVDLDEDDAGDPETPARELERQLRRIQRGETVDRLVWRL